MVSAEFHEAVAYALSCVGRHDLTLTVKEETLVVVAQLRLSHGAFLLSSSLAMHEKSSC